jgi:hypothetical protein
MPTSQALLLLLVPQLLLHLQQGLGPLARAAAASLLQDQQEMQRG